MFVSVTFFLIFFIKVYFFFLFELHQQVDAIQMGTQTFA